MYAARSGLGVSELVQEIADDRGTGFLGWSDIGRSSIFAVGRFQPIEPPRLPIGELLSF
jgi:hypothetical protein